MQDLDRFQQQVKEKLAAVAQHWQEEKQAVHDEVERRCPRLGEFDEEERRLMDRVIFPRVEKVAELFRNATLSPRRPKPMRILSVDSIKRPSSRRPRG